jgi:Winged helix-turn-helix DNA-binding
MADLLGSIRMQLRERLDELRPIVAEYDRLCRAERALNDGGLVRESGDTNSNRVGRRSVRRRRATSSPRERAANRDKLLEVVGERPGVTKAELKEATGLSSAGVAQNLRRLIDRGEVREESLPGGSTGYRRGGSEETVVGGQQSLTQTGRGPTR